MQTMNHRHKKDKNLKGWLRRKGGRMNTWSRRWFILSDKYLFMFVREDDSKSSDSIALDEHIIVEPPVDLHEPKRVYFDIVTDSTRVPSETVLSLCAESEEEKKIWVRALKRALYADKGGALFSQSLEEILTWEKEAGRRIPYIITECVEYLYKHALDVEGIFRLPGRQSVIKDLISRFERGQKVSFEQEETDIHAVASVFKAFLRDLPDSIIPCDLFQRFMNYALRFQGAGSEQEKNAVVEELASAMGTIPADNYVILKYICQFLQDVGHHEAVNKMSMMNLGTVFGYNIIRHIDRENSELFLCTADLGQNLVYMLLNYYDQVFELEYKDSGAPANNVPTADLLRMSTVLDIPPVVPTRLSPSSLSHVSELEGIELTAGSHSACSESSSNQAPPSLTSPDFINDDDSAFLNSPEVQDEMGRRPALLRVLSQPAGCSRSLPASPTDNTSPVAPERKSKLSRRRGVSERRRPEGIVVVPGQGALDGSKSPRCHGSPGGVNSDDVIAALAKANLRHDTNGNSASSSDLSKQSPTDQQSLNSSETDTGTTEPFRPVPSMRRHRVPASPGDGRVKFLQQEVDQLTSEIAEQKNRQRHQVTALQRQLADMQDKYEQRIDALEVTHRSHVKKLEAKLATEKEACAQAVAYTISLKEELHRYQMQYGELPT